MVRSRSIPQERCRSIFWGILPLFDAPVRLVRWHAGYMGWLRDVFVLVVCLVRSWPPIRTPRHGHWLLVRRIRVLISIGPEVPLRRLWSFCLVWRLTRCIVWNRVSVQGVKSLGGHFACLCRGFEFYEVKKKNFVIIFQKENGNIFTLLIIFIVKRLQKEQNSTDLLLWPPIWRNKHAITPKWFNSLDTNSIKSACYS